MPRISITDEQRAQAYAITLEAFQEANGRPLVARRLVKQKLYGIGWDTILIEYVLPILVRMVLSWIQSKFNPPKQMPADFLNDSEA